MDSYSGRFPLDFISLYSGMKTEAQDTEDIVSEKNPNEEARIAVQADTDPVFETCPYRIFLRSVEQLRKVLPLMPNELYNFLELLIPV